MTKNFYCVMLIFLFPACRISKIRHNLYYHDKSQGWPTVILYKDSIFAFNYIVPNKFDYTGPPLFPEKYFITKGHWQLKKGKLILASSPDSLAHNIESSHPMINPFVKNPANPIFSTFLFTDLWGDTVQINRVQIDNEVSPLNDSNMYKLDLTKNPVFLTFYFKNYTPYTFKNLDKLNKDYEITLQPKYLSSFFQNDTFRITRTKFLDKNRNMELTRAH